MKKKIKNPLKKRILRELRGDWAKYFVISVFMILIIGFVAGMYVANHSMIVSYNEGISSNKLEDGHFELLDKATDDLISNIEGNSKRPVEVYEQWFKEGKEKADEDSVSTNDKDKESDVRIFKVRSKVNLADIFSGRLPEKVDEIAIDRMHADNRGIKIGDTLKVAG
jgi:putative ABC transport system permease protein